MLTQCQACNAVYDDIQRYTYCPHTKGKLTIDVRDPLGRWVEKTFEYDSDIEELNHVLTQAARWAART